MKRDKITSWLMVFSAAVLLVPSLALAIGGPSGAKLD